MPVYEYHCNHCGRNVSLFYKTYKEYDAANKLCPNCGSAGLTRLISRVAIGKPTPDYAKMSSGEMLNVLDGGNSREVGQMMSALGQDEAALGQTYHEATERLMKGENPDTIERDLSAMAAKNGDGNPPPAPTSTITAD